MKLEVCYEWEEYRPDSPPCEGAVDLACIRVDERTTDDPTKVEFYGGEADWWTEQGRNHRLEDGHIKRDFDDRAWFVEIDGLDGLKAFLRAHECTGVFANYERNGDLCIRLARPVDEEDDDGPL